jgi:hypothetical protein
MGIIAAAEMRGIRHIPPAALRAGYLTFARVRKWVTAPLDQPPLAASGFATKDAFFRRQE